MPPQKKQKRKRKNIKKVEKNLGSPDIFEAVLTKSVRRIKYLLEHGVSINRMRHGYTPLLLSIEHNLIDIVKLLINEGADLNLVSNYGRSPLDQAIFKQNKVIFKLLLKKGSKLLEEEEKRVTLMHRCAMANFCSGFRILLTRGDDINSKDWLGYTPLMVAILFCNFGTARYLIELGADIESRNYEGKTALHLAVLTEDCDFICYMLNKGSIFNVRDNLGETPLDMAWKGNLQTVFPFLAHACKLEAANLIKPISFLTRCSAMPCIRMCNKELEELKNPLKGISFYDVLMKPNNPVYVCNNRISKLVNSVWMDIKFPIYAPIIKSRFNMAFKKHKCLIQAVQIFNIPVPIEIKWMILSMVDYNSLNYLRKAFTS